MRTPKIRSAATRLAACALLGWLAAGPLSPDVHAQDTPPAGRLKMATEIPSAILTPNTLETRLGTLKFTDGFPDDATVQKVYDNLDFQRGVQAFLTAMPAA